MTRDDAESLVKDYIKNERMIAHSLASEAVMRALAERLGEDVEKWGLAGLLHDIDVELVNADLKVHGLEAKRILHDRGLEPDIIEAIVMHNETASGKERTTKFEHALAAGETVTGLITATAMVYPDKKVASVKHKSVVKRMKEKAFAASVNRDNIMECEKIGLALDEFVEIALKAMARVSNKIGL